jgi:hypothetical protein
MGFVVSGGQEQGRSFEEDTGGRVVAEKYTIEVFFESSVSVSHALEVIFSCLY